MFPVGAYLWIFCKLQRKRAFLWSFIPFDPNTLPDFYLTRKKYWIESKATGFENLKKKAAAWEEVAVQFNASAECTRTVKQLKHFYDNQKRAARKDVAEQNVSEKYYIIISDVHIISFYWSNRCVCCRSQDTGRLARIWTCCLKKQRLQRCGLPKW